ncbi:MAG: hypothetical protein AAGF48_06120 [Pseudomonadota bacterium]
MRATTLEQYESPLAERGVRPPGLSEDASKLEPDEIWVRLEAYTAYRFWPREVVWNVEGPGDWSVPLYPATIEKVEAWLDDAWTETTAYGPSPHGLNFPSDALYRITADVGRWSSDTNTCLVYPFDEAYRRLAEYIAADGIPNYSKIVWNSVGRSGGHIGLRPYYWMPKALQLSGAADILRNYRRAPGC